MVSKGGNLVSLHVYNKRFDKNRPLGFRNLGKHFYSGNNQYYLTSYMKVHSYLLIDLTVNFALLPAAANKRREIMKIPQCDWLSAESDIDRDPAPAVVKLLIPNHDRKSRSQIPRKSPTFLLSPFFIDHKMFCNSWIGIRQKSNIVFYI